MSLEVNISGYIDIGSDPKGNVLTGEPTVALGAGVVAAAVQFPKIGVVLASAHSTGSGTST